MPDKKRLLLIHTGGTLGMLPRGMPGPLAPSHYAENVLPFVKGLEETVSLEGLALCNLDSSDLGPNHWEQMAMEVALQIEEFDGFVILHGTDTMAWSATALSFLLENLPKPVVFTGAQRPLAEVRTDARLNIVHSALCATMSIPEVALYFGTRLFRGNRVTKRSIDAYQAFESPNFSPLVEVGVDMTRRTPALERTGPFQLRTGFCTEVTVLTIVPGLSPDRMRAVLDSGTLGVVLQGFGSGNLPSDGWTNVIVEARRGGVPVVIGTQCHEGRIDLSAYAGGQAALDAGALSGFDMTQEAMVVKMMWLLGQGLDLRSVESAWSWPLAGEMTPDEQ